MSKLNIIAILLGIALLPLQVCVHAQKYDYVWHFGYNTSWAHPGAEAFRLDFDTFPPRLELEERDMYFIGGYSSICDREGLPLFLSENCRISNRNGETIINGDSMVKDWELDYCKQYNWHPSHFYSAFLPAPGYPDRFYYFNKSSFKSNTSPLEIYSNKFQYSIIEVLDGGENGQLTLKNKMLINDRLGYGQIASIRHGNGRDWWLPVPVEIGNKIYMIHLGLDTVYVHHSHNLGPEWDDRGGFQANFSLDGSLYVRYNRFHGVYIYDFDRCSGTLSNLRHFPFNDPTQGIYGGCAISPNNRWLYLTDFDYLYQFDLQADDILLSKQLVAVWDGVSNNLPTKFSYTIFGPDCRLYVFPPTTTKNLHVINRPDLPGESCDFRQREIEFPYPFENTPVFPNFRLGPLDGSPCDTLGIDNHPLADFRPDPTDTNALAVRFWDVSSYEPAEWLWDFGDGSPASQDTSPVHSFPAPGLYTVCLTVANQYSASSKCKVVEIKPPLSFGEGPGARLAGVRLYPNPSTGTVRLDGTGGRVFRAEVFDLLGRQVFQTATSDPTLDLGSLENGVYLLRVTDRATGKSDTAKLVINK
jgi:hypothetical protein